MKRLGREHTVPLGKRYKIFEPVITIEPGETLVVETINHMTPVVKGAEDLHAHGSDEYREREETGPIYVKGAKPGDSLAIKIESIDVVGLPHAHGSGPLLDRYPQGPFLYGMEEGRCVFPGGISVPLAPMIGDIYTTPSPEVETRYFDHGGNMDFTEIRPGNTLYLPVYRQGALLVFGDVHAVQGDGELFGEAGECAADVTVTLSLDRSYRNPRPLVETEDSLICLAGRGDIYESIKQAVEDMVGLLVRLYGISREHAYVMSTTTGSTRIGACLCYNGKWLPNRFLVGLSVPKDIQIRDKS
jgi:amidase